MSIKNFTIEDVRCFAGKQKFNISPVTFIVGENSTGKSTVLGCLQILSNLTRGGGLDFNVEPYQMGAFTDIVRNSRPQKKKFKLGIKSENAGQELEYLITLIETDKGSEPVIQEQNMVSAAGDQLVIKRTDSKDLSWQDCFNIKSVEKKTLENGKEKLIVTVSEKFMEKDIHTFSDFVMRIKHDLPDKKELVDEFIERKFKGIEAWFSQYIPHTDSFAPMRSNPKRTYDSLKVRLNPEVDEMPMVLMNISETKGHGWDELKKKLIAFGKASGLFASIGIRSLGNKSDPFQLQIKVRGPQANLIDVGYGISQILPLLVRIFTASERTIFLMQQPEVHLHPKGQAEFSSLLIELVKSQQQKFIVETHSDYMIDRARIEMMRGNIEPKDVSLIYLEPEGNKVKVHNIGFDRQGNFLEVPSSYRDFFLAESDKLLGFS